MYTASDQTKDKIAQFVLKNGGRRVSRRMALWDPPDTADNVENTCPVPRRWHGVLDRSAKHTSLYSPDLYTPSFILPRGSAHSVGPV